jgi:hypothetical protein
MDAVDEPVNWSAVACEAFESKLAEIIKRKGVKNMKEVIQRLRASKREADNVQYKEGHEAGRDWAANQAEAEELQRLARFEEKCSGNWEEIESAEQSNAYALMEVVAFAIGGPDHDGDRAFAKDFWESADIDDDASRDFAFVRGFVDGAVALWEEVRDQL